MKAASSIARSTRNPDVIVVEIAEDLQIAEDPFSLIAAVLKK